MAQRTAIEDLIIVLRKFAEHDGVCPDTIEAAIEFAENRKEMEEEQMIDFGKKCQMVHDVEYGDGAVTFLFTPEQLFEETYKK